MTPSSGLGAVGPRWQACGHHCRHCFPGLRRTQPVKNLFADMEARLADSTCDVGDTFSVAELTLLVTAGFAAKAIDLEIPKEHVAFGRWYAWGVRQARRVG